MKKGQVWIADFILGTSLFVAVVLISINIMLDLDSDSDYEIMYRNSYYATNILLTQGVPDDWNENTVVVPGLITGERLDKDKLENFDYLDYELKKKLLILQNDFLLIFKSGGEILNITSCSYGYDLNHGDNCEFELDDLDYEDLVISKRHVIHESDLIEMVLYVWK